VKHADVKQNLADYLEGDLPLEMRAGIDAHLDGCIECAEEVDEMQRTIRLLRTLPDPETPPMVAANVMRRIRAGETEPSFFGRIARGIGGVLEPTFVLPASAVAAAALVAMVLQDPSAFSRFTPNGVSMTDEAPLPMVSPGESEVAGLDLLPRAVAEPAARPTAGSSVDQSPAVARSGAAGPSTLRYQFQFNLAAPLAPQQFAPLVSSRFAAPPVSLAQQPTSADLPRAQRVAQPIPAASLTRGAESSGGEDPRDEWLIRGLEHPVEFAHFIASKNIAEHEIWVSRLAERAVERALLDDLVAALRESGDASAAILGDDFAAEFDVEDTGAAEWRVPFKR
jgi:hypothetical protein